MNKAVKLSIAVGHQAKKIRTQNRLTLEDVAQVARMHGLKWSTARVVEFENGKIPLTLSHLVIVAGALGTGDEGGAVRLADLLPPATELELTSGYTAASEDLRNMLRGEPVFVVDTKRAARIEAQVAESTAALANVRKLFPDVPQRAMRQIEMSNGLAERRAAKDLNMSMPEFTAAQAVCWGKTMTEERAARAAEGASPQALGRITRELKAEIRSYVTSRQGGQNGLD